MKLHMQWSLFKDFDWNNCISKYRKCSDNEPSTMSYQISTLSLPLIQAGMNTEEEFSLATNKSTSL